MRKGAQIQIGEAQYTVAPLAIGQIEEHQDIINLMLRAEFAPFDPAHAKGAAALILTCIRRNHPNVTLDDLTAELDLGNIRPALHACLGLSGFVESSGEATPAVPAT